VYKRFYAFIFNKTGFDYYFICRHLYRNLVLLTLIACHFSAGALFKQPSADVFVLKILLCCQHE